VRFDSFAELMYMDGHGVYVWTVYGIVLLVTALNIMQPIWARKRFFAEQARQQRREEAQKENLDGQQSD